MLPVSGSRNGLQPQRCSAASDPQCATHLPFRRASAASEVEKLPVLLSALLSATVQTIRRPPRMRSSPLSNSVRHGAGHPASNSHALVSRTVSAPVQTIRRPPPRAHLPLKQASVVVYVRSVPAMPGHSLPIICVKISRHWPYRTRPAYRKTFLKFSSH
jgi:hypothetical protein